MLKFIVGAVIGAGVVYVVLVYPHETKAAMHTVQGAANSVARLTLAQQLWAHP